MSSKLTWCWCRRRRRPRPCCWCFRRTRTIPRPPLSTRGSPLPRRALGGRAYAAPFGTIPPAPQKEQRYECTLPLGEPMPGAVYAKPPDNQPVARGTEFESIPVIGPHKVETIGKRCMRVMYSLWPTTPERGPFLFSVSPRGSAKHVLSSVGAAVRGKTASKDHRDERMLAWRIKVEHHHTSSRIICLSCTLQSGLLSKSNWNPGSTSGSKLVSLFLLNCGFRSRFRFPSG